jgi:prevent-host-death family protein
MYKPKFMAAGEFKAKCLELMNIVQRTRQPLIITKHGKPVAKLVPIDSAGPAAVDFLGCMQGSARIIDDIVAPTGVEWEADADLVQ